MTTRTRRRENVVNAISSCYLNRICSRTGVGGTTVHCTFRQLKQRHTTDNGTCGSPFKKYASRERLDRRRHTTIQQPCIPVLFVCPFPVNNLHDITPCIVRFSHQNYLLTIYTFLYWLEHLIYYPLLIYTLINYWERQL